MTAEDAWAQGVWRGDFEFVQEDGTVLCQGCIEGEDIPHPSAAVMPDNAPDFHAVIDGLMDTIKLVGDRCPVGRHCLRIWKELSLHV